jgi:hypothetical protein
MAASSLVFSQTEQTSSFLLKTSPGVAVLTQQCTRQPRAVQGFNFNAQPLAHGAGLRLNF